MRRVFFRLAVCTALATLLLGAFATQAYAATSGVFFVPHPDDDTYGMVLPIAEGIRDWGAANVWVVLVTDGEDSGVCDLWLAGTVSGSPCVDYDGDGNKDRNDFAIARRNEFRAAMATLGVPTSNLSFRGCANEAPGATYLLPDAPGTTSQFRNMDIGDRYQDLKNMVVEYDVPSGRRFHTVMKYIDSAHVAGDYQSNSDHNWIATALKYKGDLRGWDARFYEIYEFQLAAASRRYKHTGYLNDRIFGLKQAALQHYYIGKKSTWTVWSNANSSRYEYYSTIADW